MNKEGYERRKTICYSKSIAMVNFTLLLFFVFPKLCSFHVLVIFVYE